MAMTVKLQSYQGIVIIKNDNDDDACRSALPFLAHVTNYYWKKELGSMRHRRAENRMIVSFGRSDMTWRPNDISVAIPNGQHDCKQQTQI
jgi:hypothetical protein